MGLGVFLLVRRRNWSVLAVTLLYVVIQQLFNLFYNIGDILVYYIPLYLVGAIWVGFAAAGLGTGNWGSRVGTADSAQEQPAATHLRWPRTAPIPQERPNTDRKFTTIAWRLVDYLGPLSNSSEIIVDNCTSDRPVSQLLGLAKCGKRF